MRLPGQVIAISFVVFLLASSMDSGEEPALKEVFSGYFHMGAALGPSVLRQRVPEATLVVGHTLVWHNQTPAWVFHDEKGLILKQNFTTTIFLWQVPPSVKGASNW
jgi:hypothetical protein